MRELFVWYRVDAHRAEAVRAAVESMQRLLAEAIPGLQTRLLVRCDTDRQTWMETYARAASSAAGGGIDAAAEAAIAAAALHLGGLIASDRQVEAFETVPAR